jgi:hypothetical protein
VSEIFDQLVALYNNCTAVGFFGSIEARYLATHCFSGTILYYFQSGTSVFANAMVGGELLNALIIIDIDLNEILF